MPRQKAIQPEAAEPEHPDVTIARDLGALTHDPLAAVLYLFPWGSDQLPENGPRRWQREVLQALGEALRESAHERHRVIRVAISSGHGVGKSALASWIVLWALSTHEHTRGVVTANTLEQLRSKTWAELARWKGLAINGHWWDLEATSISPKHPEQKKTWRVDAIPWREERSEAFAGLHNRGRRIVVIYDEASAIPDAIWDVTEGAMTDEDTEILWLVLGNPTRMHGRFRECFGKQRHRWKTWQIDARTVEGTNKTLFDQWVADWGEDSDFVRVRVRGLFPRSAALQFISSEIVAEAKKREARSMVGDPLIMAIDVARGGEDWCVIAFRRGLDARSIKAVRIPGTEARDSMRVAAVAADLIERHHPRAVFVDATGIGGPFADRLRQLGHKVIDVQFGGASPNPKYANLRAYMWARLRDWLEAGGAIEADPVLEQDLTGVEYSHNSRDQLLLESKESMRARGLASPDWGDALAMTFAYHVAQQPPATALAEARARMSGASPSDYDPFAQERIG